MEYLYTYISYIHILFMNIKYIFPNPINMQGNKENSSVPEQIYTKLNIDIELLGSWDSYRKENILFAADT